MYFTFSTLTKTQADDINHNVLHFTARNIDDQLLYVPAFINTVQFLVSLQNYTMNNALLKDKVVV